MIARPLPRRTVLRAASAAIGLPFLEAISTSGQIRDGSE
jgi:hypothetical protein